MLNKTNILRKFTAISAVFLIAGFLLLVSSLYFQEIGQTILSNIFLNLSISVISVTLIELIWRVIGGGPMDQLLQQLSCAVPLLKTFKETGLDSFYSNRKFVPFDEILENIKSAKQVDMMAISLRKNWTSNPEFLKLVDKKVREKKCKFRFLMMDPDSPLVIQRCSEEEDINKRITTTIRDSLTKLMSVYKKLPKSKKACLEIKTLSKLNMYCSIIRIDEQMIISFYLSAHRGSAAPTIEVWGSNSVLFKKFSEEFEKSLNSGKDQK